MIETILQYKAVQSFLQRNNSNGYLFSRDEMLEANLSLGGLIPEWYIDLVSLHAVGGLAIGWVAYPEEQDEDQIEWLEFADKALIVELNLNTFPGCLLHSLGYFVFAYGSNNAGNCFAFQLADGEDPAVYEVWHDAATTLEEMTIALRTLRGVTKVSHSFSQFIHNAIGEPN